MVGSAINRFFKEKGYENIIIRDSGELDLTNQQKVSEFSKIEKPRYCDFSCCKGRWDICQ